MAEQNINVGTSPNSGTGDPLRTAFVKTDDNFNQIWAAGPVGSNVRIQNNVISTLQVNQDLALSPNGVGNVRLNNNTIPGANNTWFLGSVTNRWRGLYVGNVNTANLSVTGSASLPVVGNISIPGGTNGYVLSTDGNGNLSWVAQGGAGNGNPGGANTQIQFNDSGLFAGSPRFTFNKTSNVLTFGNIGFVSDAIYDLNGLIVENADLSHGATAALIIPANGSSNAIQLNNIYGNVVMQSGANSDVTASWTFNNTGNLQLPGGGQLGKLYGDTGEVSLWPQTGGYAGISNHDGSNYITAWDNGVQIGVVYPSSTKTWDFGTDGTLNLPTAVDGNAVVQSTANINIVSNAQSWTFDNAGNLTLPSDISSINYANGQPYGGGSNGGVTISNTAPMLGNGQVWWNSNDGRAYVKYNSQFIDLSPSLVPDPTTYVGNVSFDNIDITNVGNIIPAVDNVYSLGSTTFQWKDLWVSGNTIYMNRVPLTIGAGNVLQVDGVPVGGQITANGTFCTLPDFLEFVSDTLLRTGQTSEGVFFSGDASNDAFEVPVTSYPVRTNFSIPGTTKVVVTVDMVVNDECSDFGLCVFEQNVQPQWQWGANATRLSAQYDCTTPVLTSFTDEQYGGWSLPGPGTYRVRFTYDPNNSPNLTLETLDTSDVVLNTTTLDGTLNTSVDYCVGFAADQDNDSLRTYIQNLNIAIDGGATYTDSLQLAGGGNYGDANVVSLLADFGSNIISTTGNVTASKFIGAGSNVELVAGSNTWTFDDTGTLTFPNGMLTVNDLYGSPTIQSAANLNLQILASGQEGVADLVWLDDVNSPSQVAAVVVNNPLYVGDADVGIVTGDILGGGGNTYIWNFGADGTLALPIQGNIVGLTPDNSGYMKWVGNSSGDGSGYTTLQLIPDETLVAGDQYLIIDPTVGGHIHIRAGGTQNASYGQLYLGGENNFVRVADNQGLTLQNLLVTQNTNNYADPADFTSATWFVDGGSYYIQYTSTNAQLDVDPYQDINNIFISWNSGVDYATLTYAGASQNLGGGVYKVSVNEAPPADPTAFDTLAYTLNITTTNTVTLDSDGFNVGSQNDVTLIGNGYVELTNTSNTEGVLIRTDGLGNAYNWLFGVDGTLVVPGDISGNNGASPAPSINGFQSLGIIGNITTGNILTDGYYYANGAPLSNYGDSNVVSLLSAFGSNTISTSGNVTAGNLTTGVIHATTVTNLGGALNLQSGSGYDLVINPSANISVASNWINNLKDPVQAQDAATKKYVDDNTAGLNIHDPALLASTTDLATYTGATVTYNNGTAGVGATLTFSGNTLTTLDGTAITGGSTTRLLIKNEANAVYNGVYNYTSNTVLTRSTDMDQGNELTGGDYVFVESGVTQASSSWVQQGAVGNVGVGNVNFVQFSASQSYSAGNAMTLSGSQFNVNVDNSTVTINGSDQLQVGTVPAANVSGLATVATTGNYSDLNGAYGNANVANYLTSGAFSGNITTTGNITGGYILGNGSQLTGLPASYGDSNVVTLLGAFGSNTISTSGNISAGNINIGIVNAAGQIVSTAAGNSSTGSGQIYLNGASNNRIDFNTNGIGAPAFTNRSVGAKIVLYPSLSGSSTDYALGVDAGTLWSGIPGNDAGQFFKWYGGTTQVASLSGTGAMSVLGNITAANLGNISSLNLTGSSSNVLYGNGVFAPAGSSYGNANVANFLANYGSNTVVTTGNITGGNIIGTLVAPGSNTQVLFNDANVIAGNANMTFTKTTGNLNVTGNIIATGNVAVNGGVISTTATTANVFNTTPTTVNIAGGATIATNIGNASGTVNLNGNVQGNTNGFAIGYRDIPQVTFAANATAALSDAGKHYYSTSATNLTLTVPNNASVGFAVGTAINLINQGAGTITVAQGTGVTMYFAGNSISGNRTVSSYGMATLQKVATDTWFIVGVGVA